VSRSGLCVAAVAAWPALACTEASLDAVGLPANARTGNLASGLVAHWTLDEGSGAAARDDSGNEHHGQVAGGSWISDGRFSGGLRLTTGDSVLVPGFPQAAPSFTVAVWIRLSTEQLVMDNNAWVAILSTENFQQGGWQLNIDNRSTRPLFDFAYWITPLRKYLFAECDCVEVDRWIHLAAVVDEEANQVTLYRDGAIGDQQTRPADITPGDSTLYFGRWNKDERLLSGDLDDIAVWNRPLSANEIATLTSSMAAAWSGTP
jgi:hypothetical protein